jgi:hypothetical protein
VPPIKRQRNSPAPRVRSTPTCFPSLHALAKLDQQLVGRLKANQTGARVLDVEDDVDDDDRDDHETEDVVRCSAGGLCLLPRLRKKLKVPSRRSVSLGISLVVGRLPPALSWT